MLQSFRPVSLQHWLSLYNLPGEAENWERLTKLEPRKKFQMTQGLANLRSIYANENLAVVTLKEGEMRTNTWILEAKSFLVLAELHDQEDQHQIVYR